MGCAVSVVPSASYLDDTGSLSSAESFDQTPHHREWHKFSSLKEATDYYSTMAYVPRNLTPLHVEMLTVLDLDW